MGKTQWRNFPSCQMKSSLLLKACRDRDWQSHVVWSPGKVAKTDHWLAGHFMTWSDCRLLVTLNSVTNCEKTATTEVKTGFSNFTCRSISRCCGTQSREALLLMKVSEQLIAATLEFSIKEPKWQKTYLPSQVGLWQVCEAILWLWAAFYQFNLWLKWMCFCRWMFGNGQ